MYVRLARALRLFCVVATLVSHSSDAVLCELVEDDRFCRRIDEVAYR